MRTKLRKPVDERRDFLPHFYLLAFLFHTVLEMFDARYRLIRRTLPRRKDFFNDADRALYRAKAAGKDCVAVANDGAAEGDS